MTFVTQTLLGDDTMCGNCTEAAIASLLDLPIDAVPNLNAIPNRRLWVQHIQAWCLSRSHYFVWFDFQWTNGEFDPPFLPRECLHLMSGTDPNGNPHMVVGQGGLLLWDPSPDHGGITDVDGYGFLVPFPMHHNPGITGSA